MTGDAMRLPNDLLMSRLGPLIALSILLYCGHAGAKEQSVSDFCRLLRAGKASEFLVRYTPDNEGKFRAAGLDFSGAGKPSGDTTLFCPDSSSLFPADVCELSIEFSDGKKATLQADRISLYTYRSRTYAVTSEIRGVRPNSGRILTRAYSLINGGFNSICGTLRQAIDYVSPK